MNKENMISALAGTAPVPVMTVDRQSVQDIMKRMKIRHSVTASDYDKIYQYFVGGRTRDICKRLWEFCRSEMKYVEESVEVQNLSCPYTILKGGRVDCKNYSLFCGGVLDAMKRAGKKIEWCYRFACYEFDLFNMEPGHVFVVVNENTDDIWVDPVLGSFDYHLFYWKKKDQRVEAQKAVAGLAKVGNAENDLLASVKQYSDGLNNAMQVSIGSQTLNTITWAVLGGISAAIPALGAALAVLKLGGALVNNAFGPGSEAALLINDFTNNPLTAPVTIVETLFNGRTYNTDQYWAAQYYQYYVLGKGNITREQQVADKDIIPALKWFIDRLGVFISGREHLIALTQSPQAYLNYYNVNSDTTNDLSRATAAYNVASKYFNFNGPPGSWAQTIGVYDETLVALALQSGRSVEQLAAQQQYQNVYSPTAQPAGTTSTTTLAWAAVVVLLIGASIIK